MNATLGRDPFFPTRPGGRGPALALALLAHAVLLLGLAFGVNWRSSEPPTLAAELWSAVPQAAAPRAVEPPPTPPPAESRRPEPVVKPAPPKPEPQALPDPQIAIEKAKRDEAKRLKADEEKQEAKREKAENEKVRLKEDLAQKKVLAEKQRAERQKVELANAERAEKAEAARDKAIREQNLKRMQGLAGASGGPADTGTALRSSGPSDGYAGRIVARIKPNIVFTEPVDGNPVATVEVKLAPDGTIIGKRLLKSSGVKAWDDAVLRAIERTEVLPRDTDGRVPPPFPISFRLRDQ